MTEWFIIQTGEFAGRLHLSGWSETAIRTLSTRPRGIEDDEWIGLSICPRCYAIVFHCPTVIRGDQTWVHEQWHAATDFPIPDELAEQARRWGRSA